MFKCFDFTVTDCDVFLYFEFGATELNSTFETTPCYWRATAGSNSYEFDTAILSGTSETGFRNFSHFPSLPSFPTNVFVNYFQPCLLAVNDVGKRLLTTDMVKATIYFYSNL